MGYSLTLSAELEGVTSLQPADSLESPFEYTFQVQCTSCREIHSKEVNINTLEKHEMSGSRGEANFVFKCQFCKRESSANITRTKKAYTIEDDKPVAILDIDSRGLEIVKFIPVGNFICSAVEGPTKFTEVDLSDNEWYDYDDNAGAEVSITDVKWDFVKN
ncbi:unnamed protein product [Kuraishia capsulata CBS 1993]|uniref:DUF866-domain-containing protein n=1 Tax=Kuraishia capsulata CBS 1993 TaxID=1382522 RepID=W6MWB9_9ASCO|nr:uncharacterized protein KUCA_T00003152001 [Kuraishia capsulata CBS 1993]CDK27175.1 unnamed protein product [Kuraishia capsulata CBS 1993]